MHFSDVYEVCSDQKCAQTNGPRVQGSRNNGKAERDTMNEFNEWENEIRLSRATIDSTETRIDKVWRYGELIPLCSKFYAYSSWKYIIKIIFQRTEVTIYRKNFPNPDPFAALRFNLRRERGVEYNFSVISIIESSRKLEGQRSTREVSTDSLIRIRQPFAPFA